MPKVYSEVGSLLAEVDDKLYRDFLDEVLVEDKDVHDVLMDYNQTADTVALSDYIKWRLGEVDRGYAPTEIME